MADPRASPSPTRAEEVEVAGPYTLSKTLGHGSYGKVKLGMKNGNDKEKVAVKILKKRELTKSNKMLKRVEREIALLKILDHPCITRMVDVIQNSNYMFIVLEYVPGGDLFHYLRRHGAGGIPIDQAFKIFYQILSGLEFTHSCCICHRDIKPENILLGENGVAKLADFGLANLMEKDQLLETSCGSPHYASPEVIQGVKYDGTKSDIWSLGIVLYGMCAGRLPFDDANIPRLLEKVCRGEFTMPSHFDGQLRDLISQMLNSDASQRITIEGIKRHSWWTSKCAKLNLDRNGLHTTPDLPPRPRSALDGTDDKITPARMAAASNVVQSAIQQKKASVTTDKPNNVPSLLKEDCNTTSDVAALRAMVAKLQQYGTSLAQENAKLTDMCTKLQAENDALDNAELLTSPIPPHEMQTPVTEPFDEDVVAYMIQYYGMMRADVVKLITDSRPSQEKAYYKLLSRHKAVHGSLDVLLNSPISYRVDTTQMNMEAGIKSPTSRSPKSQPVSPNAGNGSKQVGNAVVNNNNSNNVHLTNLLRNCKMQSDTALLKTMDQQGIQAKPTSSVHHERPTSPPLEEKRKSSFRKVLGYFGKDSDKDDRVITIQPQPYNVTLSKPNEHTAPNVSFLNKSSKLKSAPSLVSKSKK